MTTGGLDGVRPRAGMVSLCAALDHECGDSSTGTPMIPDPLLNEFTALYQEHFGTTLTPDEARVAAMRLVNLLRVVYRYEPPHAPSSPE